MKIAIMQPYVFPFIGYFQLVKAVDLFVFYDDVNFIKRGWVNRNQLLINNEAKLFTVPVLKASQNKLINEIELGFSAKWKRQFYTTLTFNYKKAPYFEKTYLLVQNILELNHSTISELAIDSIIKIADFLDLKTVFEKSSSKYSTSKGLDKADRLIKICNENEAKIYVNPSGGKELYRKTYFKKNHIDLFFIENEIIPYQQFNNSFVGVLSIIDIMMFNSKEQIQQMLNKYSLA